MTTEKGTRQKYTGDFKQGAVVTKQGYKLIDAAQSLDIKENFLRHWKREFVEKA